MKKIITIITATLIVAGITGQAQAQVPAQDAGDQKALMDAAANPIRMSDFCGAPGTVDGSVIQVVGIGKDTAPTEHAMVTLKCKDGTFRAILLIDPTRMTK